MADSTLRVLDQYHADRFHPHLHKPTPDYKVETFYAYQLGVVSAAQAAHGVSNKWQGIFVIPLADNDEIHAIWVTPHDLDSKFPMYLRWGLIPNNDTSASTLTTTVDYADLGATHAGSDAAGDGATALNETIKAIVAADTTANIPFFSVWGKMNGRTTDFDILFVKLVSTGNSGADRLRVFCLQLAIDKTKRDADLFVAWD